MLTDTQRGKCQELAAILDHGDLATWQKVEGKLSAEEKGEVWALRAHVRDRAVQCRQLEAVAARPARMELHNLDYWGAEPVDDPDDDGDDAQPPTRLCPSCRGSGRAQDGGRCEDCAGSGRLPFDDEPDDSDDDDDDNDDENEKKSYRYEFEEE